MATVSNSQVTIFTPALELDGCPVEIWRIASGAAPADTSVITPARIKLVKAVLGPVQNNVPATGASNVTVTITGNGATTTVGQIDVMVIGFPR